METALKNSLDQIKSEMFQNRQRILEGIGCMEALIKYANTFGESIEPKVVAAEAAEAILRLRGEYGKSESE